MRLISCVYLPSLLILYSKISSSGWKKPKLKIPVTKYSLSVWYFRWSEREVILSNSL